MAKNKAKKPSSSNSPGAFVVSVFLSRKHGKESVENSSQVWERRLFLPFEPLKGWSRGFHRRPPPFSPQSLPHQRLPNPKPATCKKLDLGQERWLSGYATKPEVIPKTYLVVKKRIQRILPWAPHAHCGGTSLQSTSCASLRTWMRLRTGRKRPMRQWMQPQC